MKVATLTGEDLNRAVAKALGHRLIQVPDYVGQLGQGPLLPLRKWAVFSGRYHDAQHLHPATTPLPNYADDISFTWPIIVEHKISLEAPGCDEQGVYTAGSEWLASIGLLGQLDPDPLIAALRCFVAAKYGDNIDLEKA